MVTRRCGPGIPQFKHWAIISLAPHTPYVDCESRSSDESAPTVGAPGLVSMPCLKNEDRIELNIDMVRAGVAALSELDRDQEQDALIVIEIFYRMLGEALIQDIPTSS
jgi:hypothetical protein